MQLEQEVYKRGGLAATHELLRIGATSHLLTRAVRGGRLIRVRQGWYGLPHADPSLESAVRVGGRASCVTAARELGLWTFSTPTLHIRMDAHDSRPRQPSDMRTRLREHPADVRLHWRRGGTGTRHMMGALDVLDDMIGCQTPERVVAAVDSALRTGLVTHRSWQRLIEDRPERLRAMLAEVDPRSESILESIARFRLRRLGYVPAVQDEIPRVGRVDLRLGHRLVIELDGWEHHQSREAFEEDRRRDAELARLGVACLRLTARQLLHRWSWVRATVAECVDAAAEI